MNDSAVAAREKFRKYIHGLFGEYGLTLYVKFPGGSSISLPLGGARVLDATPIFNRDTGAVESYHYLLMFAEMGVLDLLNAGHPVHVHKCAVEEQADYFCDLREVDGDKKFHLHRNDPHFLDSRQEAVYKAWDAAVERAGGVGKLEEILDRTAERWRQNMGVSRGEGE